MLVYEYVSLESRSVVYFYLGCGAVAMEMFRSLWRPRDSIAIPTYEQGENSDQVDLLVKSLYYLFRRLNLDAQYNPKGTLQVPVDGLSVQDMENLDKMYNRAAFEQLLLYDKHRVLVDWFKNRFRTFLVLSHTPQMETLPRFPNNKYVLVVLPADASNDEYVKTLSTCCIYSEHNLPLELRQSVVEALLARYPQRNLNTRAKIILGYMEQLAIEVQVARLYKASLRSSRENSPLSSPLHSRESSPVRDHGGRESPLKMRTIHDLRPPTLEARSSSPSAKTPQRSLSPKKSSTNLRMRSPSPTRDGSPRKCQSPSPERSPQRTSRLETRPPPKLRLQKSNATLNKHTPDLAVQDSTRKVLLDQSRHAVRVRLEREAALLKNTHKV